MINFFDFHTTMKFISGMKIKCGAINIAMILLSKMLIFGLSFVLSNFIMINY